MVERCGSCGGDAAFQTVRKHKKRSARIIPRRPLYSPAEKISSLHCSLFYFLAFIASFTRPGVNGSVYSLTPTAS
jgi:hypothetical protein